MPDARHEDPIDLDAAMRARIQINARRRDWRTPVHHRPTFAFGQMLTVPAATLIERESAARP